MKRLNEAQFEEDPPCVVDMAIKAFMAAIAVAALAIGACAALLSAGGRYEHGPYIFAAVRVEQECRDRFDGSLRPYNMIERWRAARALPVLRFRCVVKPRSGGVLVMATATITKDSKGQYYVSSFIAPIGR